MKRLRGLSLSDEDRQKVAIGMLLESSIPFAGAFRRAVIDEGRSSEAFASLLTPAQRRSWDNSSGPPQRARAPCWAASLSG